jgi:selenium metabolism protein YedF
METKKALAQADADEILVWVDNPASRENVRRFAESQGHQVTITEDGGVFSLKIIRKKSEIFGEKMEEREALKTDDRVILIDSDSLGRGSDELGKILMRTFMHTLEGSDDKPQKIILINGGVKLACAGSEVLEDLQNVAAKGVEVLCCGTCLDYFGLKTSLQVGRISNMYEILEALTRAGKTLKL